MLGLGAARRAAGSLVHDGLAAADLAADVAARTVRTARLVLRAARGRPLLSPATSRWTGRTVGRGVALAGRVWTGDEVLEDAVVIVGPDGRVAAIGPGLRVPEGVRLLRGAWVGPGIVDAHVHLAFGDPGEAFAGGVVAVRDLGGPLMSIAGWRAGPVAVAASGPIITAAGGYPTRSWGAEGFGAALPDDPRLVATMIATYVRWGADLVKIALEPGDGLPVPTPAQVRAVVEAAHAAGLPVTAHALTVDMVARALDAGVDELAHTPVEVLPPEVVDRIADAGIPVVSTLQTFCSGGDGRGPGLNAAALVAAGVPLVYGTDLGNTGTRPGVDPRELDRLADAGLGRAGALRAATAGSAALLGGAAGDGTVTVGAPARLVVLGHDPLVEVSAWRSPVAVVSGTSLALG